MKIPNFPSWYHCGTWNFSSDAHRGSNGPWATTASTFCTASATRESCARAGTEEAATSRTGTRALVYRISRGSSLEGQPGAEVHLLRAPQHLGGDGHVVEREAEIHRQRALRPRLAARLASGDELAEIGVGVGRLLEVARCLHVPELGVVVGGDPVHLRERGTAPVRVVVDGGAEGALAEPVALDRRHRLLQDRAGGDDEVGRRHRLARPVDTHDLEAEALGHLAHVEVLALAPPVV